MSLDIQRLKTIGDLVNGITPESSKVELIVTDARALDYINKIPLAHSQPYLRTAYMKYYFKAKQEKLNGEY